MNIATVAENRFTADILKAMDQVASNIEGVISSAYRENDPNSIQEGSEALAVLSSIRSQLSGPPAPTGPQSPTTPSRRSNRRSRARQGGSKSSSTRAKAEPKSSGKKRRTLTQQEKDRRREVKLAAQRGDFTAPEVLRPYLLCAIHNLSAEGRGPVKFQEAQKAMVDIMEPKGILKEGDHRFITGSQRPRHMAQTAAMRRKLLLEGIIRTQPGSNGETLDELTDKGFEELKASQAADSMTGARRKRNKRETVNA
jgi:hypothetical protein